MCILISVLLHNIHLNFYLNLFYLDLLDLFSSFCSIPILHFPLL